jgi:nucleoside 2-deoxyribosyltransferase
MHRNFRNDMIKVYVASPYTLGDVAVNVKRQIDAVDELMNKGFAPFAPLYSHFQHMIHPRSYQDWIKVDLEWVKVCDCVLRLEGESSGADGEVKLAKELNIPVYYSFDELYRAYGA